MGWASIPDEPSGLMQLTPELEAVLTQAPYLPVTHTFGVENRKLYGGEQLFSHQAFWIDIVGTNEVCEVQPEQTLILKGLLKGHGEGGTTKQVIQIQTDFKGACPKGAVFIYDKAHFYTQFALERDLLKDRIKEVVPSISFSDENQVMVLGALPYVFVMNLAPVGKSQLNYFQLCEVRGGSKVLSVGTLRGEKKVLIEILSVPQEYVRPSTENGMALCPTHTWFLVSKSLWEDWVIFKRMVKDVLDLKMTNDLRIQALKEAQTLLKTSWVQQVTDGLPCELSKGMKVFPLTKTSVFVVSKGDASTSTSQCEVGNVVVNTQKYHRIF